MGGRKTVGRKTGGRKTGGRKTGSRKTGARKKAKYIADTERNPAVRMKSGSQKEVRQTEGSQADRRKQATGRQQVVKSLAG
jgi:hypothetical protein